MIMCLCGALIITRIEHFSFEGKMLGNCFILGAAACTAINTLIQRGAMDRGIHPYISITWPSICGAFLVLVTFSPFGSVDPASWDATPMTWLAIVFTGLVSTALSWTLNAWALKIVRKLP